MSEVHKPHQEPETPKERAENVLLALGVTEYANLAEDAAALANDVLDLVEQLEAARSDIDAMEQLISYLGEEHLSSQAEAHLRTFWATRPSNPASEPKEEGNA